MKFILFVVTFSLVGCLKIEKVSSPVSSGGAETLKVNPNYPVFLENSGPLNTLTYVDISLAGNYFEFGNVEKIEISGTSRGNVFTLVDTQIRAGVKVKHLLDPEDENVIITISRKDGTVQSYEFGINQEVIEL